MTVFANGLEVACKAQGNKVIADFPDVCFTPPENPATPPGVPIPYPSFGLDSDTDSGTSTVKIGGKTITQKNKSYYSRTTGTEAGCAAKKGVITSVNTGKEYAVAWSSNVKADGEPVNRMTDLSTNNHASPTANAPPWPKIGKLKIGKISCAKILGDLGIKVHKYKNRKKNCKKGKQQSDHLMQNACANLKRRGPPTTEFPNYNIDEAPCICLNDGTNTRTQHGKKTLRQNNWATSERQAGKSEVSYPEARDKQLEFTAAGHDGLATSPSAMKCLKMIIDTYFKYAAGVTNQTDLDKKKCRVPGETKKKKRRPKRRGRK
ncbi:DUF4150 domain-containing protein [Mesorhizobium sp. M2A.F.Ca.ET.042.01.1.1]|uniref:DUF4150 domain-containing protein n=1 Tax=Mesorhizobium sp. M2A.F.Ca.ET.042.01.1.1 TaxID=2496745 RepID=UPI001FE10E34|nr:DUF4150 domain-containing protein [Mesorhizobium sp. M2A.F.Ca.ET.042.01.1.1]